MAQYTHPTKYGPVEIHTKSIDDAWVAFVGATELPVDLPPDDEPLPHLEEEAVELLLRRIDQI